MNEHHKEKGYLALYIGPMYSGKTSKLLNLYKQFNFCNISVAVINYIEDTRYSNEFLSTHDKIMIPCIMSKRLHETFPIPSEPFNQYDVYLINESQFFPDIVDWVKEAVGFPHKKKIYLCGLDGDFKRNVFGNWLDLIAFSDTVEKLTSLCCDCRKNAALFSYRITKETDQKVIGSDSYLPLCRNCYELRNL